MKLAIIAGGKGDRLRLKNIPKPMIMIGGKPLLEHQINLAKRYGIKDIYILSGYLSSVIVNYFGDGKKFDVHLTHLTEDRPLGTAGAVKQLEGKIKERFMVFYGDTLLDVNLLEMVAFDAHSDSIATILVHPNDHPYDSDLVDIDKNNCVTAFYPKPHQEKAYYRNLVNAALYILGPDIFQYIPSDKPSDFGKDIFPLAIKSGRLISAYKTPEYIKDIGIPKRLAKTREDFLSGKVARLNKSNKRKAIFLDRDGVINKEVSDLRDIDEFELMDGVDEAIKRLNNTEYLVIVVTNQPVIAKGFCTEDGLNEIHKKMETLLGQKNAYLDGVYYCPHHPQKGFLGEVAELKVDCECRKPKTKMIFDAVRDFNIDLSNSHLVGDRYRDIATAKNAGLKAILIKTGFSGQDKKEYPIEADRVFENLNLAASFILNEDTPKG